MRSAFGSASTECIMAGRVEYGSAVKETRLAPHIKCFAHMPICPPRGVWVKPTSDAYWAEWGELQLFFCKSSTASTVLASKQKLMELPSHMLIDDVATHWNSTLIWLNNISTRKRLWQQHDLRHNALDSTGISNAEDIVRLFKPLKKAAAILNDEKKIQLSHYAFEADDWAKLGVNMVLADIS